MRCYTLRAHTCVCFACAVVRVKSLICDGGRGSKAGWAASFETSRSVQYGDNTEPGSVTRRISNPAQTSQHFVVLARVDWATFPCKNPLMTHFPGLPKENHWESILDWFNRRARVGIALGPNAPMVMKSTIHDLDQVVADKIKKGGCAIYEKKGSRVQASWGEMVPLILTHHVETFPLPTSVGGRPHSRWSEHALGQRCCF